MEIEEIEEKTYKNILTSKFYGMKSRCEHPTNIGYKHYGGRGIKVNWTSCKEFINDVYDGFKEHVKLHGLANTSIDRIDVNGNYCKENCRWATRQIQANNRRVKPKVKREKVHHVSVTFKQFLISKGYDISVIPEWIFVAVEEWHAYELQSMRAKGANTTNSKYSKEQRSEWARRGGKPKKKIC